MSYALDSCKAASDNRVDAAVGKCWGLGCQWCWSLDRTSIYSITHMQHGSFSTILIYCEVNDQHKDKLHSIISLFWLREEQ